MKRIPLLCVCVIIVITCHGQSLSRYLEVDFFPRPVFDDYEDIDIQWNFDGKLQSYLNSGITELKELNYTRATEDFDEAIKLKSDFWISFYYRGIAHRNSGDLEDAIADFEACLRLKQDAWNVYAELAEAYQAFRKLDLADRNFDKVRDLAPNRVEGYFGIANISFLKGDFDRAQRFYKKSIDANPDFPNAYLRMALLKLLTNWKERQAMDYLNMALQKDSTYQDALYWRGLMHLENDRHALALKDWGMLARLNPTQPYYQIVRGFLYIELKEFDLAFTDLKNAILSNEVDENQFRFGKTILNKQIDLHAASTYLMRNIFGLDDEIAAPLRQGYCLLLSGSHLQAVDPINASIRLQPSACAYFLKGLAFEYAQKHDSALVAYEKTLALDNDIFEVHKKRAIYRTNGRDWKGAVRDFMDMERLQPASIVTARLRGTLKYGQSDFYGAIIDFSQYLKTDSLNNEILKMRGVAHFRVGNYSYSEKDFRSLMSIDSADFDAYTQLYVSVLFQQDTARALAVLKEFEPNFPLRAFAYIQRMEIFLARKQWDLAIAEYQRFGLYNQEFYDNQSEALYLKAMAYAGKNDLENATATFTASIERGLQGNFLHQDALFERGRCYLETGHRKKAVADFKRLRESNYQKNTEFIESILNSK